MNEVYNYILNELELKYGDTVVVAVSGGPDSMSLLHVLIEIKKALDIFIVCAHVNHNIRRESVDERAFVEKYCDNHGVTFECLTIEEYGEDNFHNEARTKRYEYFDRLVKKYGAKYLFTAHHADDLIETILMRIVRGSTLKGYSGFSKVLNMGDYKIIRPLITVTKETIYDNCKKEQIPFVEDASNKKMVYTRNRYRKYILPFLKSEDSNVHEKFLKFSETLLEYNNYIDRQITDVFYKIYRLNTLNLEEFSKLDAFVQMKILYYILEHLYQDDLMLINDNHAKLMLDLIHSKKPNTYIYLPNGLKAIKEYNQLTFLKEEIELIDYEVVLDDLVNLPNGKNIESVSESEQNDNNICRLNKSDVKLPLYVRNKRIGDKMEIKGMMGSKKVKDIFINAKVTTSARTIWPIVVDSSGKIVWIPGLKKSKLDIPNNEKCDIILKYY